MQIFLKNVVHWFPQFHSNNHAILQITGKNAGKKFVSLFASYHQEDTVFNDIKYLQSPASMFLITLSCNLSSIIKDYCCSHIAVESVCSCRWCETCNSSTCYWSFIKSWNKIASWGHTLPGRCSRYLSYLFSVLFMIFLLTLSSCRIDGRD